MAKDQSDSESGNPLAPNGLLFLISSKGSFICRQHNTYVYMYVCMYVCVNLFVCMY